VALRETERNAWKAWASAKTACDQGLVARPLSLFVEATEIAPVVVYLDAAEFALGLNRSLERLVPVYRRHARSFGLAPDAYPIYLPGTKIGPEGWEFVLNCLLAANVIEPSRLDIQEKIADVLEERERFGEALAWRNGIETADPRSLSNSMAIARLLARTRHFADAEAHYLGVEAQSSHNIEVLLRLISIFQDEGDEPKLHSLIERIDREFSLAEQRSGIDYQVFLLGLILEIARQRPLSPSRELLRGLRRRCDRLLEAGKPNLCILLSDALLAFVESDGATSARRRLCKATIAAERAAPSIDVPEIAAKEVAEAANYAEVLISHPGFPNREREPLPAVNAAVLCREQARTLLDEGKAGDALPKYAASLKAYHVTEVPTQYEVVGDHKLVLHEQRYYVIPREIQEFMIWEGTVYRLTGIGRHTRRHVPAWLIRLLLPYVGLVRNLKARARAWRAATAPVRAEMVAEFGELILRWLAFAGSIGGPPAKAVFRQLTAAMRRIDRAVPQLRSLLRPAVRLAHKIQYRMFRRKPKAALRSSGRGRLRRWLGAVLRPIRRQRDGLVRQAKALIYHLKRIIFKISWSRYAVRGVVTAQRREAALALIAKISKPPLAAGEPGPLGVRRDRLNRVNALGPGA
jgi:hypothetical protein